MHVEIPVGSGQVFAEISPSGFEEVSDGFLIFFIAESAYPLDDSQTKYIASSNRNIGVVKVSKDLSTIMTSGDEVTGGHYGYDRSWIESSYSGVMWITDYQTEFSIEDLEEVYSSSEIESKNITHITKLKHVKIGVN